MTNEFRPARLVPYRSDGPAQNMAIDQLLLDSVSLAGLPALRLYGWSQPTLSLGYFQTAAEREKHQPSRQLALVRRATGGGAIVHHHELTYSLAVPFDAASVGASQELYRQVHGAISSALAEFGVCATTFEKSGRRSNNQQPFLCFMRRTADDLIIGGYKVLGSAQRKTRYAILQHGSLLLRASEFAPELPGLNELTGRSVSASECADCFIRHLGNELDFDFQPEPLTRPERDRVAEIASTRYAAEKWNRRR